jgi:hypothetical protein
MKCREIPTICDFRVLRTCNTLVARAGLTPARLTMKFEMATLYSAFAVCRAQVALGFEAARTEWGTRIKRMFCDVFGHFDRTGVAKRRHSVTGPIVVVFGLLAGCAGVGGLSGDASPEVKRDVVAQRAKARWDRLIASDLAGAYEYMSPASRATTPLDLYKAKHKVGLYRSVKVDDVHCEADTCTVDLSLTYDYKGKGMKEPMEITTPLTEKWIISQGQAWFVDRG